MEETGYQMWKSSSIGQTLIYTGILESDKTVLLANIVDDLDLYVGTNNAFVAYFFCRHDIVESLQAQTVIESSDRGSELNENG